MQSSNFVSLAYAGKLTSRPACPLSLLFSFLYGTIFKMRATHGWMKGPPEYSSKHLGKGGKESSLHEVHKVGDAEVTSKLRLQLQGQDL